MANAKSRSGSRKEERRRRRVTASTTTSEKRHTISVPRAAAIPRTCSRPAHGRRYLIFAIDQAISRIGSNEEWIGAMFLSKDTDRHLPNTNGA